MRLLLAPNGSCNLLHYADISVILKYRKQHIQPFCEIFKCSSLVRKLGYAIVLLGNALVDYLSLRSELFPLSLLSGSRI